MPRGSRWLIDPSPASAFPNMALLAFRMPIGLAEHGLTEDDPRQENEGTAVLRDYRDEEYPE